MLVARPGMGEVAVPSPPNTKPCFYSLALIFIYQRLVIRPFSDAPVLG